MGGVIIKFNTFLTRYRCKRHLIIYGAPWPQRIPLPSSEYSSRENTPSESYRSSNTPSVTANQRLKAAWLAQMKRAREKEAEEGHDRASKRRKISSESPAPATTKSISNFSGRTRLPSLKVRERDGPEVKVENGDSASVGRKRAAENELEDNDSTNPSKKKKGTDSSVYEVPDKPYHNPFMDEDGDDRRDKTFWPAESSESILPPLGGGIHRTGFLLRPNPAFMSRWRSSPVMRYSGSTDSTPTLVDDDTDNDVASDEHPSTPENEMDDGRFDTPDVEAELPVECAYVENPPSSEEEEEREVEKLTQTPKKPAPTTLKGAGLIIKPNPVTLAKRTWAPSALIIADPEDEVTAPSDLAEPRTPPRHRRLDASSGNSTSRPIGSNSPQDRTPGSISSVRVLESRVRKPRSIFDDYYDASSGEEVTSLPNFVHTPWIFTIFSSFQSGRYPSWPY